MTTMLAAATLEEALAALVPGEHGECLACGEPVECEPDGAVECAACGSRLDPGPSHEELGQLAFV
jgi:hypothetical protein